MTDERDGTLNVESLLAAVEGIADPPTRAAALDLLEAVMGLHRAGLARMLEVVGRHPAGGEMLKTLRADQLVASLLESHDLLTEDLELEARVRRAIEKIRPYMHGHGGDVDVLEVREGRVSLRLVGACHGCGFSETTLRLGIERTLREDVPELREIVVLGAA